MSVKPVKGDRVVGTINRTAFTGTVMGVVYRQGKCLVSVRFDFPIDVLHGYVSEHRFVPGDLEVL